MKMRKASTVKIRRNMAPGFILLDGTVDPLWRSCVGPWVQLKRTGSTKKPSSLRGINQVGILLDPKYLITVK